MLFRSNKIEKHTEKILKFFNLIEEEYLFSEFLIYLGENGMLSQWTPPGTPQHNDISERKNRILLDMVQSMMGFATLSISFWGYTLETTCVVLNNILSKSVCKTPYEIWSA